MPDDTMSQEENAELQKTTKSVAKKFELLKNSDTVKQRDITDLLQVHTPSSADELRRPITDRLDRIERQLDEVLRLLQEPSKRP